MSQYKPRVYKQEPGRVTVKPFKEEDVKNILILLQKKRDKSTEVKYQKIYDRDWMLFKIGVNSALRIEDLAQLKVDDNLLRGYLYTREMKTGKEQSFEMNYQLAKDIKEYIKRNNLYAGEYLFQSGKGKNKPITRQNAYIRLIDYADEVGVRYPIGCHSMRKFFARNYCEKTGDILTLQKMLNHSSYIVTLRYICWDDHAQIARKETYI